MPLYGFHTLLCVIFAFLIPRANKIAILIGTNISLPPTVPFITWTGYNIRKADFRKAISTFEFIGLQWDDIQKYDRFVLLIVYRKSYVRHPSCHNVYFLMLWFVKKKRAEVNSLCFH